MMLNLSAFPNMYPWNLKYATIFIEQKLGQSLLQ